MRGRVTLALCGDVMTGRGVDQILPRPGDPRLQEAYVRDARDYVRLAEAAHGAIPRPVDAAWPWGEALPLLDQAAPDARVINLETSVTSDGVAAAGKTVHYRMHPANLACLTAARPDVCVLANNHVLDFGDEGLVDTLDALHGAGLVTAGAGRDLAEAERPAVIPRRDGGRVLVFAAGTVSSGIPYGWCATSYRAGVTLLPDLSPETADRLAERVARVRRPGDVVILSLHWGSNWGYGVPDAHIAFAHRIVESGVDVLHGHSSHHPRPIEVHQGRLILYGTGDFIDDYEGIAGYEHYRDDLRLLYLADLDPASGELRGLRMAPLRARRMRLEPASPADRDHLCEVLDEISRDFDSAVRPAEAGMLQLTAPA